MHNISDTTQVTLARTNVIDLNRARYRHPLPNLTAVPLLAQHNADLQTVDLVGHVKDSSSRSPSQATEFVLPPNGLPARISSVVLQKWEGFVLEVGKETFIARLAKLVGEEGDQIAEIYCTEIDDEDQLLLEPGAIFYWSIGYLDKPSGRERFSQIRFRRLPMWSAAELRAAEKKAEALGDLLDGAMVR